MDIIMIQLVLFYNIMGTLKKIQLDSTYDPIDYFKR
ncbi:Uncharacterised protein [Prevotella disiens]|uniref:Uncharacterized protein n=1 Tax=Prevotella disiens TaxID=28130 RepID=A0A379DY72_9BACT|nr:Uncharacterised protein [Prevotella disiens]